MKKIASLLALLGLLLTLAGCSQPIPQGQIAATTLPVYTFTQALCQGTPLTVTRLVTQQVSCLHDYTLNVQQVKAAEAAQVIVISGAGLETFLEDLLAGASCIDASAGIPLLESAHHHSHSGHPEPLGHSHEADPHIWLSPAKAAQMAENICQGLSARYPEYAPVFQENLLELTRRLEDLQTYGEQTLQDLACRELITFHDGFSYLAQAFDLTILAAVEEESGSEASAQDLIALVNEVNFHHLPAVFTEVSGSVSAAGILARETGCQVYSLDMAISGEDYFSAMYRNIDTLKEALG